MNANRNRGWKQGIYRNWYEKQLHNNYINNTFIKILIISNNDSTHACK